MNILLAALAIVPLTPFVVTFLPLLTAETTLFTVANVFFGFLIVPTFPSNLLDFTAFILAFTAFWYLETFLLAIDLTPDLNSGLSTALVTRKIRSSMACSSALRSAAPRSAAASSRACPSGV